MNDDGRQPKAIGHLSYSAKFVCNWPDDSGEGRFYKFRQCIFAIS